MQFIHTLPHGFFLATACAIFTAAFITELRSISRIRPGDPNYVAGLQITAILLAGAIAFHYNPNAGIAMSSANVVLIVLRKLKQRPTQQVKLQNELRAD